MTTPPPPCGCYIKGYAPTFGAEVSDLKIVYCPLHAHAERLRDALEKDHKDLCIFTDWEDCEVCALLTSCREKGGLNE